MASSSELLRLLTEAETMTAAELARALSVSQPTVSRLLRAAGEDVLRLGKGRATRYAAARRAFTGFTLPQPIFEVTTGGRARQIATINGMSRGRFLIDGSDRFWLLGERGNGIYDDLPWFLQDLRPQGFMGRAIAQELAAAGGYPVDPALWRSEDVLRYLLQHGHGVPGNLVTGEAMACLATDARQGIEARETHYPKLSRTALGAVDTGSSAGGDQPKFAATLAIPGEAPVEVIVKFSAPANGDVAGRWRDLLIAEYHAQNLLWHQNLAAETRLHDIHGRLYLESVRFDRTGRGGRIPAFSLQMIDAEFCGEGISWSGSAEQLRRRDLLDDADYRRIIWLDCFGAWIANSDRHLGNLSLAPENDHFVLLPAYDMLPMGFRPARDEIVERPYRIPLETRVNSDVWEETGRSALEYWQYLCDETRLNDDFRRIAERASRIIRPAVMHA